MRPISKNFNRAPAHLTANNLTAVINIGDPTHKDQIRQTTYGHDSVVTKLREIYSYKCAYCEAYEPEPEVEHYRPKRSVAGEALHNGYYWLCYEWSNLMPACHDCNKRRSKGTHFPVEGVRQTAPVLVGGAINFVESRLISNTLSVVEIPLLLNPEFPAFNPFDFFRIDSVGKFIPHADYGTLAYRKAETTIEKIRLNRDKLLLGIRKREIKYYMGRIKIILFQYLNGIINPDKYEIEFLLILKEIKDKCKVTKTSEYWFFWNYFLLNLKFFLTRYFKGKFRLGLHRTYDNLIGQV